ncbi:MAG: MGMT family protein [Nitrososphaeria archaeon]|nr:MGMT family protein [Nitrososphaeria archaeon]
MKYSRKSWQEKLIDRKGFPKILKLEKNFPCYNAVHKMGAQVGDNIVLVNPSEVINIMKMVPRGRLVTITEICQALAKRYKLKACCSLTTGIFIMMAANAVEEAKKDGKDLDIPYWRTLKANGFLNEKYPGGLEAHKNKLENEGFTIIGCGRRLFVKDYKNFLMDIK